VQVQIYTTFSANLALWCPMKKRLKIGSGTEVLAREDGALKFVSRILRKREKEREKSVSRESPARVTRLFRLFLTCLVAAAAVRRRCCSPRDRGTSRSERPTTGS
jgi:hypothetical protein